MGLWLCGAVCFFTMLMGAQSRAGEAPAKSPDVREVIIVFKTHFDIGYTDFASNVVQRYRTAMIDQALDVVGVKQVAAFDGYFSGEMADVLVLIMG